MQREALQAVEQDGIVFIDEIDKIVTAQDYRHGRSAGLPFPRFEKCLKVHAKGVWRGTQVVQIDVRRCHCAG